MASNKVDGLVLGLDLGVTSVGWALVRYSGGEPVKIEKTGVRIFDAGVDGDFESGRSQGPAVDRRRARLMRRMLERGARRHKKLFNALVGAGLLPAGDVGTVIRGIDKEILSRASAEERDELAHVLPYKLRARALDERLSLHEIGRAIYHLGQRRGYQSNRKSEATEEVEEKPGKARKKGSDADSQAGGGEKTTGQVLKEIGDLEDEMKREEALTGRRPTLGQLFARLDPRERRIRGKHTSRPMYKDEFERIWAKQRECYPDILTDRLRRRVFGAIFHQRRMKSTRHLIGKCQFEKGRTRASMAFPISQRYRLISQVNNIRVKKPGEGAGKSLDPEQRQFLIDELEKTHHMTFEDARKRLKLAKGCKINLEGPAEEEGRLLGNETNANLAAIFTEQSTTTGQGWWAVSEETRERIVADLMSVEKKETLTSRGMTAWNLKPKTAEEFAKCRLSGKYSNLSRKAMRRLMPLLEEGLTVAEAVMAIPEYAKRQTTEPVERLPRVSSALGDLRNPAVNRILSETRKVVNAIVAAWGKPAAIRIELARDLRRSKKDRKRVWDNQQKNKRKNDEARKALKDMGLDPEKDHNLLKWHLWQECNKQCPYSYPARMISCEALFGPNAQVHIEHIIPFSRCLDNSFMNKTLCYAEENQRKHSMTPHEAYAGLPQYDEILMRVRNFGTAVKEYDRRAREEKLRRFQMDSSDNLSALREEEWADSSMLNDTRYATKLAAEYLGLLYGGTVDANGTRRVQASRGGVTGFLRNEWRLNEILGDGGEKNRDDHRNHAVDAIVVAVTDARMMHLLSAAAVAAAQRRSRRLFEGMEEPFGGFLDEARGSIERVKVSHRQCRKVNGPLHKASHYGPSKAKDAKGTPVYYHIRKALVKLGKEDVIVDERIRAIVADKLAGRPAKVVFKDRSNHPCLPARDGRQIPIHNVRVKVAGRFIQVGRGAKERHVLSESNHHIEIVALTDAAGGIKELRGYVVSRYEAMMRLARKQPVVLQEHAPGEEWQFSLSNGDMLEADWEGERKLLVVRGISGDGAADIDLECVEHVDARKAKDRKAERIRYRNYKKLKGAKPRKVIVTPLGEVRTAND